MPAVKKRVVFVEHKVLSGKELETVLSGSNTLPWFNAVMQVIREQKSLSMDVISTSVSKNNQLAMSYGAGGMDLADALIVELASLCAPKPE